MADVEVSKVLAEHTDNHQRSKQNARLVRNIFEGAIVAQGNRIEVDASYEELFALANGRSRSSLKEVQVEAEDNTVDDDHSEK